MSKTTSFTKPEGVCWQQYNFRILSHQDDNTKAKQYRASQNNLSPKAIHSEIFSSQWKTLLNTSFSHLYSFRRRSEEHRTYIDREKADQIPSFQATSHLQKKAIRMHAPHPNPRTLKYSWSIYMFMDSRQPPFAFQSPQPCSTNPFSSNCTGCLVLPAAASFIHSFC
jgi:hypothetical protein